MNSVPHPAEAVIAALADTEPLEREKAALLEIASGAVLLTKHGEGESQEELRACDRGWSLIRCGLAHLAGRRHISEA